MATDYFKEEDNYPMLHIRIKPLIFEFLKESGATKELSPHQEAKRLLIQKMIDDKLLPTYTLQHLAEDILVMLGKKIIEDVKNGR